MPVFHYTNPSAETGSNNIGDVRVEAYLLRNVNICLKTIIYIFPDEEFILIK